MAAFKLRTPGSFADAATQALAILGRQEIMRLLNLRDHTRAYKATNESDDSYCPYSTDQALTLDVACHIKRPGEIPPFLRAYQDLYEQAIGDEADTTSIFERVGRSSKEYGEAIQSVMDSVSPDSDGGEDTTPNEARSSAHEIDEAIRELEALKHSTLRRAGIDPIDNLRPK